MVSPWIEVPFESIRHEELLGKIFKKKSRRGYGNSAGNLAELPKGIRTGNFSLHMLGGTV